MSAKFNKKEYGKTKKQWKVDLPIEEKEEYDSLLDQYEITKIDFLRNSFKKFKEELKMIRYIIVYEDEKMKNEKESTYEYSDCEEEMKMFNTLEEARKEFDKFKGYFWEDGNNVKTLYKRIATLHKVQVDDNDEIISDYEQIDTK